MTGKDSGFSPIKRSWSGVVLFCLLHLRSLGSNQALVSLSFCDLKLKVDT
jgi:hypothetical protein